MANSATNSSSGLPTHWAAALSSAGVPNFQISRVPRYVGIFTEVLLLRHIMGCHVLHPKIQEAEHRPSMVERFADELLQLIVEWIHTFD